MPSLFPPFSLLCTDRTCHSLFYIAVTVYHRQDIYNKQVYWLIVPEASNFWSQDTNIWWGPPRFIITRWKARRQARPKRANVGAPIHMGQGWCQVSSSMVLYTLRQMVPWTRGWLTLRLQCVTPCPAFLRRFWDTELLIFMSERQALYGWATSPAPNSLFNKGPSFTPKNGTFKASSPFKDLLLQW